MMKSLDKLGTINRGRSRHRPRNDESLYNGEYPFVQTGDIKNSELHILKHGQTYNEKGLSQSKLWPKGTLCITIAANIAETAVLSYDACFPDSVVGFIADEKKSDVYYVKYSIDYLKTKLQQVSKGTTQDNLSLDKLLGFGFDIPEVKNQRRISNILLGYDFLIENNTRRIAILEESAQRLYREWFVHFRFPGHEKAKMVESELGPIPKGWQPRQLGSILEFKYGKGLRKEDRVSGDFPVYGSSGIVDYHSDYLVEGPGIIVGRKGNVGSTFLSESCFYPIDTVYYVESNLDVYYLFYLLSNMTFISGDTAVPGLSRESTMGTVVLLPDKSSISEFGRIVGSLLKQKSTLENKEHQPSQNA